MAPWMSSFWTSLVVWPIFSVLLGLFLVGLKNVIKKQNWTKLFLLIIPAILFIGFIVVVQAKPIIYTAWWYCMKGAGSESRGLDIMRAYEVGGEPLLDAMKDSPCACMRHEIDRLWEEDLPLLKMDIQLLGYEPGREVVFIGRPKQDPGLLAKADKLALSLNLEREPDIEKLKEFYIGDMEFGDPFRNPITGAIHKYLKFFHPTLDEDFMRSNELLYRLGKMSIDYMDDDNDDGLRAIYKKAQEIRVADDLFFNFYNQSKRYFWMVFPKLLSSFPTQQRYRFHAYFLLVSFLIIGVVCLIFNRYLYSLETLVDDVAIKHIKSDYWSNEWRAKELASPLTRGHILAQEDGIISHWVKTENKSWKFESLLSAIFLGKSPSLIFLSSYLRRNNYEDYLRLMILKGKIKPEFDNEAVGEDGVGIGENITPNQSKETGTEPPKLMVLPREEDMVLEKKEEALVQMGMRMEENFRQEFLDIFSLHDKSAIGARITSVSKKIKNKAQLSMLESLFEKQGWNEKYLQLVKNLYEKKIDIAKLQRDLVKLPVRLALEDELGLAEHEAGLAERRKRKKEAEHEIIKMEKEEERWGNGVSKKEESKPSDKEILDKKIREIKAKVKVAVSQEMELIVLEKELAQEVGAERAAEIMEKVRDSLAEEKYKDI